MFFEKEAYGRFEICIPIVFLLRLHCLTVFTFSILGYEFRCKSTENWIEKLGRRRWVLVYDRIALLRCWSRCCWRFVFETQNLRSLRQQLTIFNTLAAILFTLSSNRNLLNKNPIKRSSWKNNYFSSTNNTNWTSIRLLPVFPILTNLSPFLKLDQNVYESLSSKYCSIL